MQQLSRRDQGEGRPAVAQPLCLIVGVGLLLSILCSWRAWLPIERTFPQTPVIPGVSGLPLLLHAALFVSNSVLCVMLAFCRRNSIRTARMLLGSLVFCAVFDQILWQAWVYQYSLILGAIACSKMTEDGRKSICNVCRVIVACTYFWSGFFKLNVGFATTVCPEMISQLVGSLPNRMWCGFGLLCALVELSIGLALFTGYFRKAAVFGAIAMHVLILICIGPLGTDSNRSVWPWNLTMIALDLTLFLNYGVGALVLQLLKASKAQSLVLILCMLLPALHIFDGWDAYFSFALYDGAERQAALSFSDAAWRRLPNAIKRFEVDKQFDRHTVSLMNWASCELDVPPIPERRFFRQVLQRFSGFATGRGDVVLLELSKPSEWIPRSSQIGQYDALDL